MSATLGALSVVSHPQWPSTPWFWLFASGQDLEAVHFTLNKTLYFKCDSLKTCTFRPSPVSSAFISLSCVPRSTLPFPQLFCCARFLPASKLICTSGFPPLNACVQVVLLPVSSKSPLLLQIKYHLFRGALSAPQTWLCAPVIYSPGTLCFPL